MGTFGSIAGAETALTRDFGRHVFEMAALSRVPQTQYNYRVSVVEMVWFELAAPHAVLSNRVSATRLDRCDLAFAPRGVRNGTSARTCSTERGGKRKMRRPAGIVRLVRMNRPVDPALRAPRPQRLHRRKLLQGSRGFASLDGCQRVGGRLSKVLAGHASLTRSASAAQVSKSGWGDWRQQWQHK